MCERESKPRQLRRPCVRGDWIMVFIEGEEMVWLLNLLRHKTKKCIERRNKNFNNGKKAGGGLRGSERRW